ncbi:MAG TPA: hypothetical protein VFN62_06620 [Acidobacteriaceae bacterium]|nr:hypothetical protein [Acidobacteriaceae bacterium]
MNCDETHPPRSLPIAYCLRRFPDRCPRDLEASPAHHAQQILQFKKVLFEAAKETTKEDEKRAKEVAEETEETP